MTINVTYYVQGIFTISNVTFKPHTGWKSYMVKPEEDLAHRNDLNNIILVKSLKPTSNSFSPHMNIKRMLQEV